MQDDFARNVAFNLDTSFRYYDWLWSHPAGLLAGLPFSLTLLAILLAHEGGHFLAARYHRVDATLPYFLPSPVLGTFGAFIRVRTPILGMRSLFDIGIAGPLAGAAVLLPALALGIAFSKTVPGINHHAAFQFGSPALQYLLSRAIWPEANLADLYLHPVARAAWMGMFTTALNLLPIGQLDGGHIFYSLFPAQHRAVSRVLALLLLPMGKFFLGWVVWGVLLLWLGRNHPTVCDTTDIGTGRRRLAAGALAIFLLCFTLVPIAEAGF
jgi:membrane-associated protease RseP (regulator of RpoE activity)